MQDKDEISNKDYYFRGYADASKRVQDNLTYILILIIVVMVGRAARENLLETISVIFSFMFFAASWCIFKMIWGDMREYYFRSSKKKMIIDFFLIPFSFIYYLCGEIINFTGSGSIGDYGLFQEELERKNRDKMNRT